MARVRFADMQCRPVECLDCTSVTLDELPQVGPPCAAAFHAPRAAWRLDGKPRTARQFRGDKNGPLPPPAARLCFLLPSLKTYSLQVVQGRLFGMGQSKAKPWRPVLLPALRAAWRPLGAAPTRSLAALAQGLGVSEAEAAPGGAPLAEEPAPLGAATGAAPASPLVPMTGPRGGASAPKLLLHSQRVRAARKATTWSKMSCSSMPSAGSSF